MEDRRSTRRTREHRSRSQEPPRSTLSSKSTRPVMTTPTPSLRSLSSAQSSGVSSPSVPSDDDKESRASRPYVFTDDLSSASPTVRKLSEEDEDDSALLGLQNLGKGKGGGGKGGGKTREKKSGRAPYNRSASSPRGTVLAEFSDSFVFANLDNTTQTTAPRAKNKGVLRSKTYESNRSLPNYVGRSSSGARRRKEIAEKLSNSESQVGISQRNEREVDEKGWDWALFPEASQPPQQQHPQQQQQQQRPDRTAERTGSDESDDTFAARRRRVIARRRALELRQKIDSGDNRDARKTRGPREGNRSREKSRPVSGSTSREELTVSEEDLVSMYQWSSSSRAGAKSDGEGAAPTERRRKGGGSKSYRSAKSDGEDATSTDWPRKRGVTRSSTSHDDEASDDEDDVSLASLVGNADLSTQGGMMNDQSFHDSTSSDSTNAISSEITPSLGDFLNSQSRHYSKKQGSSVVTLTSPMSWSDCAVVSDTPPGHSSNPPGGGASLLDQRLSNETPRNTLNVNAEATAKIRTGNRRQDERRPSPKEDKTRTNKDGVPDDENEGTPTACPSLSQTIDCGHKNCNNDEGSSDLSSYILQFEPDADDYTRRVQPIIGDGGSILIHRPDGTSSTIGKIMRMPSSSGSRSSGYGSAKVSPVVSDEEASRGVRSRAMSEPSGPITLDADGFIDPAQDPGNDDEGESKNHDPWPIPVDADGFIDPTPDGNDREEVSCKHVDEVFEGSMTSIVADLMEPFPDNQRRRGGLTGGQSMRRLFRGPGKVLRKMKSLSSLPRSSSVPRQIQVEDFVEFSNMSGSSNMDFSYQSD